VDFNKLPQSAKDILREIFDSSNGSLKEPKNFLIEDSVAGAALKNIVGDYTCLDPEPSAYDPNNPASAPAFFLNKIKCFEKANTKTFKQILAFIEAMIRVVDVINQLDKIKDLIILLDPNRVLEKTFDKNCDSGGLSSCIEQLKNSITDDPLVTYNDEFNALTIAINKAKCDILNIYDMTKGGIPVDANGATTTNAIGTPTVTMDTVFYKFTTSDMGGCGTSACPAGWEQYLNWGTTEAAGHHFRNCTCKCDTHWHDSCSCTTSFHPWGNPATFQESCSCKLWPKKWNWLHSWCVSGDEESYTGWATVTAIGCVPKLDTTEYMKQVQGFFANSLAKVKERTEEMTKELMDLEKKIDNKQETDSEKKNDIKTPMRGILHIYYFLLGIKAFDAIADIDIGCKCYKDGNKNNNSDDNIIKCSDVSRGTRKVIKWDTCGLQISSEQFKCIYKQARVFIGIIKCGVKKLIELIKSVKNKDEDSGETQTSEGKEIKDSVKNIDTKECDNLLTKEGLKKALDCKDETSAGPNTGGKGTTGTGSGAAKSIMGGWQVKEIARCVVNPAYSIHRVDVGGNPSIIEQTGPKGGPVCGETSSHFSAVETQFSIVRKKLQDIDLSRRNLGVADLFRITLGKIIPGMDDKLEKGDYGAIKYSSITPVYDRVKQIRNTARLVWAISTAINFTSSNCTCGQSFCLFPVCISGLPLTIEAITNPFCYLTYMLRHPLLNAIEKLETELGER
jgi:hypothetical protein